MQKKIIILISLLWLASCAPTALPPRVSTDLLQNATQEDAEALEKVEREIIVIPDKKIVLDKKNFQNKIALAKATIELKQAQEEVKTSKATLAELEKAKEKDEAKIAESKSLLFKQETTSEKKSKILSYYTSEKKTLKMQLKLLDAELALKVAMQMLQEAVIADLYLSSEEGKLLQGYEPIKIAGFKSHLGISESNFDKAESAYNSQLSTFEALTHPDQL